MPPSTRFLRHFEYGLLRETPAESLHYEQWADDGDMHMQGGYWHTIQLNPFTASMSEIPEHEAEKIAGGQLHDQADDAKYAEQTRTRLAEHESA